MRIDDDPCRVWPGHAPHRQLRVVENGGADPDHDSIDQRAQSMQMVEPGGAVDVMGIPAGDCDAGIDGLAALSHQDEVVDRAFPQRPENVLPWRRQRAIGAPEDFRYPRPGRAARAVRPLRFTIQPRCGSISHARHLLSRPLATWHISTGERLQMLRRREKARATQ
jgi:hypothetical protein